MAKFFAIFNIVAAAASIAGFGYSLQIESRNELTAIAFAIAFALSLYVLFAPANPIERNAEAKLQHFRRGDDGQRSTVQRGEFSIVNGGPVGIQFHQPFAESPEVRITHLPGQSGRLPYVVQVSTLHAEFAQGSYQQGVTRKYQWIAHGKALEPLPDPHEKSS